VIAFACSVIRTASTAFQKRTTADWSLSPSGLMTVL